jgi:hypothetical protein
MHSYYLKSLFKLGKMTLLTITTTSSKKEKIKPKKPSIFEKGKK